MKNISFTSWDANLINVNRRRNRLKAKDRYEIVLHGLKANEFEKHGM